MDVRNVIERVIRAIAEERKLVLPATLRDEMEVVFDLGFSSLMVATLIARLEEEVGIDPFRDEDVMISDLRTVGDMARIYAQGLARAGA